MGTCFRMAREEPNGSPNAGSAISKRPVERALHSAGPLEELVACGPISAAAAKIARGESPKDK